MNSKRLPSRSSFPVVRSVPRRSFLKGLAFAPAGLAASRLLAQPAGSAPASSGPRGRTLAVDDRGYRNFDEKDGGVYMALMTHSNGIAHLRRLCRYQPGPTQFSHGHPAFSRDDKWVAFNSRIGTKENVAMAEIGSLA